MLNYALTALFCFLTITVYAAPHGQVLECKPRGSGWAVANATRNFCYSEGFYFDKRVCETAVKTAVGTDTFGVVCATNPNGSSVYSLHQGTIIANPRFYFNQVTVCALSLQWMRDWVVCVPHEPSSMLYDIRNQRFIGEGNYYNSVEFCKWSSASASSNDSLACGPNRGGTAVYNRETGGLHSGRFYNRAEDCYRALRGNDLP